MKKPRKYIEVYKAKDGFRWRAKTLGQIVGVGDQAYTTRWSCHRGVKRNAPALPVFDI